MKKDTFSRRAYTKIQKTSRKAWWRVWLLCHQTPAASDRHFCRVLGVKNPAEGVQRLRAQKVPNLLPGDANGVISGRDASANITPYISIFGKSLPIDKIERNWHSDWVNGGSWVPDWHWRVVKVKGDGSDVKVPWELSRCQFMSSWALAYASSGNSQAPSLFVKILDSWLRENPLGRGVNWTCAMDVAIRAANWILVWPTFRAAPQVSDSFVWRFFKCLLAHGLYLVNNLEGPGWWAKNHYLSNLAGLIFLGAGCPAFGRISAEWFQLGKSELEREIKRQILPDGVCFEESASYHRLSLEIFLYAHLMAKAIGSPFSPNYQDSIRAMLKAVDTWTKPSGCVPQIGDNDSGRFLCPSEEPVLDHRYLLDIGVDVLHMPELKREDREPSTTLVRLGGKGALKRFRRISIRSRPSRWKASFPFAGWQVLQNGPWWVMCVTGNTGQHSGGGHAHADRLSFELCFGREDVFIDPGTYVYTPNPRERRLFRSPEYHNVLHFGLVGTSNSANPYVFLDERPPCGHLKKFIEVGKTIIWQASSGKGAPAWVRTLRVKRSVTTILDEVENLREVHGNLNLHPDISVSSIDSDKGRLKLIPKSGTSLYIRFFGIVDLQLVESWYSPEYAVKQRAKQIRYRVAKRNSGFSVRC